MPRTTLETTLNNDPFKFSVQRPLLLQSQSAAFIFHAQTFQCQITASFNDLYFLPLVSLMLLRCIASYILTTIRMVICLLVWLVVCDPKELKDLRKTKNVNADHDVGTIKVAGQTDVAKQVHRSPLLGRIISLCLSQFATAFPSPKIPRGQGHGGQHFIQTNPILVSQCLDTNYLRTATEQKQEKNYPN